MYPIVIILLHINIESLNFLLPRGNILFEWPEPEGRLRLDHSIQRK